MEPLSVLVLSDFVRRVSSDSFDFARSFGSLLGLLVGGISGIYWMLRLLWMVRYARLTIPAADALVWLRASTFSQRDSINHVQHYWGFFCPTWWDVRFVSAVDCLEILKLNFFIKKCTYSFCNLGILRPSNFNIREYWEVKFNLAKPKASKFLSQRYHTDNITPMFPKGRAHVTLHLRF